MAITLKNETDPLEGEGAGGDDLESFNAGLLMG